MLEQKKLQVGENVLFLSEAEPERTDLFTRCLTCVCVGGGRVAQLVCLVSMLLFSARSLVHHDDDDDDVVYTRFNVFTPDR